MKTTIRSLNENDRKQVEEIDQFSCRDVASMIDSVDYAWGVFKNDELIAYCTMGGADELDVEDGAWLLSDLYVKEEYRNQGYASQLIDYVIEENVPNHDHSVYLVCLDERLINFYENLGFKHLEDGFMVKQAFVENEKSYSYIDSYKEKIEVFPRFNMYIDNDNLFMGLDCYEDGYRDCYCNLTVNICSLPFLQSAIDITYSGNEKIKFLTENGFGELTGKGLRSGYCVFPIFQFNAAKINEIDPIFFDEYSKKYLDRLDDKIQNVSMSTKEQIGRRIDEKDKEL